MTEKIPRGWLIIIGRQLRLIYLLKKYLNCILIPYDPEKLFDVLPIGIVDEEFEHNRQRQVFLFTVFRVPKQLHVLADQGFVFGAALHNCKDNCLTNYSALNTSKCILFFGNTTKVVVTGFQPF